MVSTPQLVIETAISLFNARGIANVTVREIAAVLSISPGNLTYHFANKDKLVEAVIRSLIAEMEGATEGALHEAVSFAAYARLLQQVWEIQRRYRFFYLDAVEILRSYPKARGLYRGAVLRRLNQSRALFLQMCGQGLLAPLSARERDVLVKRSWLIVASWSYRLFVLDEKPSRATFVNEVLDVVASHATLAGVTERRALARERAK